MPLYFGYGANMNIRAMGLRCPAAEPIGKFTLTDSALVFRGVADCIYRKDATCIGALWRITEVCERALDRFEGIAGGFYRKEYVEVEGHPEPQMMLYVMNSTGIFPPSQTYADTIRQGYRDFKVPMKQLDDAIAESWDKKAPSYDEHRRHQRRGFPTLVRHPKDKSKPKVRTNLFDLDDESRRPNEDQQRFNRAAARHSFNGISVSSKGGGFDDWLEQKRMRMEEAERIHKDRMARKANADEGKLFDEWVGDNLPHEDW